MLPLIAIGAVTLYGAYKAIKGTIDSSDATDSNQTAVSIVDTAKIRAQQQRDRTNAVFQDYGSRKLRAFNGVVEDFLDTFGQLKNVEILQTPDLDHLHPEELSKDVLQSLRDDYELLKDAGLGLGAGLTGGAAVAFGAYNGTILLASASTGTAISTLSGVAATNATLAWLGGGSIAAGGGGMALGTLVLGGLVAAPALAIFGYFIGSKGEEALANAQSNLEKANSFADSMNKVCDQLVVIQKVTTLANKTFSNTCTRLRQSVGELRKVIVKNDVDYQTFAIEDREVVFQSVKYAQLIKALIDTPIIDSNGNLVLSTQKRVDDIAVAIK